MNISLICTVRNEADNIAALLDSMLAQRRAPDEIVINDCGSVDATAAIVAEYATRDARIKLIHGGFNIPSGRNNAVRAAAGPIIACTDAGLTLDPNWLGRIVAPIEQERADLVGGFFRPAPQSVWELALGATNYRFPEEINPDTFLPFGQSMAFRKDAWEAVGGFPEWASHCEDILFDLALKRAGYRMAFVPDAQVVFRPRSSLRAFIRQYFLYARGDGRAGLWGRRYVLRYGVYAGALALLLAARQPEDSPQRHRDTESFFKPLCLCASVVKKYGIPKPERSPQRHRGTESFFKPVCLCASVVKRYGIPGILLLGAVGYTRAPYRRLWPQTRGLALREQTVALSLVPLIRVVGDAAKMAGYPVGVVRRIRAD